MVDDLQTLCTIALRGHYTSTTASEGTPTPIDGRAVSAFFESLEMEDNPGLQVESAWALTVIADRLTPEQQSVVQGDAIPLLIHLLVSEDETAATKAEKVLEGLIPGDCAILRNLDLGPIVRGVTGDDEDRQAHFANLLARLLAFNIDCPEFIQRISNTGVLPRFVEFLRRDDQPYLQKRAVSVLTDVVRSGNPDQTRAVVDEVDAFIPNIIRVLGHPNSDDDTNSLAAMWIGSVAHIGPAYRDMTLQCGAVPPLLDLVQSTDPDVIRTGTFALREICETDPPPNVALIRPAVPILARLVNNPDDEVAVDACWALGWLVNTPLEVIQPVVDAGACRRLVELLRHQSVLLVHPVLDLVSYIVAGNEQQLQAIADNQPLPSLVSLLSSPDSDIRRIDCWIIVNLARRSHDRIQQIIDHGVVPPLLRCLADEDGDVRSYAAEAVGILTAYGTPEQVLLVVEEGCLPLLCDLLADPEGDAELMSYALGGIENALVAGGGGPAEPNAVAVRIATDRGGGLAKILALALYPDDGLRARATRLVATYFGAAPAQGDAAGRRPRTRRSSSGGEGAMNPPPPPRRRSRRS